MGIYVHNKLTYVVKGTSIDTSLALASGEQQLVVEAWDKCGKGYHDPFDVKVVKAAPAKVTISASPTSIVAGSSATLTVVAANASQVKVSGSDGSSYGLGTSGGHVPVSPSATTTYIATAIGTLGSTSASAIVTVNPPPSVNISASPSSITAGSSSTLTVSASNATAVKVSGSDGSSYTLGVAGGTLSVSPKTTTTYTATATDGGVQISSTATVTVNLAPTVTIKANPTSIAAGSSSTLTVTANNASQVTVSGSDGSLYTLSATGGTQSVTPTAETTYTATATGFGGTGTATAVTTVSIAGSPNVMITANPVTVNPGSPSVLTVAMRGATQVTINGSDGSSYTLGSSGGTQSVSPSLTTTYTATATGAGGQSYAAVTVNVTTGPTVSITANSASIIAGNSSLLNIAATNASQVTVTGSDGSSYTLGVTGGTQSVNPSTTTTYTATATGASGNVSAVATVIVVAAPNVLSNLQTSTGWKSFGQLPPNYSDCSPCSGISWTMEQGISSPSLSGDATEFDTSGTVPYAVVLWVNPVIGQFSTQGLPDPGETIVPATNNFTYSTAFYITNASITWALEFDVAMYTNGTAMFWGTQCDPQGDGDWDVLNDPTTHWIKTGVPCSFVDGWNYLTLQFQRLPNNTLLYNSVTLNGVTSPINMTYGPYPVPSSWYGITMNFQMDGNKNQAANTVYLDNFTLTYW
jgi:hypothetical protein